VNGFSADHFAALQRYGTKRVLIAYDADEAGELAAHTLVARLYATGIACWRIQFPSGLDANEYARQYQPTKEQWAALISKAVPLGEARQSTTIAVEIPQVAAD